MLETDSPPADVGLPATAWLVLGVLSLDRELSGYEIKKRADGTLRFLYWSPAMSHIYSELKRLESAGYATSSRVAVNDSRSKRVYAITDSGRAALTDWLRSAPDEPLVIKHGVALRVWLGHLAAPEQLRHMVRHHRDHSEELRLEAHASLEGLADRSAHPYATLAARWAERHQAAERDLADQMLADLAELER